MNNEVNISLSIKPTWSILKEVQEKTENFMKEKNSSKELIDATVMCSSELIENAIKYGGEKPGGDNISFDLTVQNNLISIQVTNGIKDTIDLNNVIEHIDKVKSSKNPGKLYTDRLMELMENTKPGISQLGLYRIAYEGEFKLDYKHENNILTIIAERSFK